MALIDSKKAKRNLDLEKNPLYNGLADFAQKMRCGDITALNATQHYLDRISRLNPLLDAYIYIDEEQALKTATAIDSLLQAGIDLGPLMGVPVAVKDVFAVNGMPVTAGSNIDLSDCIGNEGPFIQSLRKNGCVILGKTRSIEFAAGAQNLIHPTPRNPCDMQEYRTSGGSSHGSAVAVAAGLCGFAIGTDTGGSVRQPAALCGVVGMKTTHGIWPTDGLFPLCPSLDTVGLLTANMSDASIIYTALTNVTGIATASLCGANLGVFDPEEIAPMDALVKQSYKNVLNKLKSTGANLTTISWPNQQEIEDIQKIYAQMIPANLLTTLGMERFERCKHDMDPVAVGRIEGAVDLAATDYIRLTRLQKEIEQISQKRMEKFDAIIGPTVPFTAPLVSEVTANISAATDFIKESLRYTRAANVYNLCALTLPITLATGDLPVGIQISCQSHQEQRLLALSSAIATIL